MGVLLNWSLRPGSGLDSVLGQQGLIRDGKLQGSDQPAARASQNRGGVAVADAGPGIPPGRERMGPGREEGLRVPSEPLYSFLSIAIQLLSLPFHCLLSFDFLSLFLPLTPLHSSSFALSLFLTFSFHSPFSFPLSSLLSLLCSLPFHSYSPTYFSIMEDMGGGVRKVLTWSLASPITMILVGLSGWGPQN